MVISHLPPACCFRSWTSDWVFPAGGSAIVGRAPATPDESDPIARGRIALTRSLATLVICLLLAGAVSVRRTSAGAAEDAPGHFLDSEADEFAADADADTYAGPAPLTVRFTAHTINATRSVRYRWDFDDGSGSTVQNPRHTFRKRGWYLVTMEARDAAGQTYRINLQVHAWRPRDWERFQKTRDMRIANHAARELERKRARAAPP